MAAKKTYKNVLSKTSLPEGYVLARPKLDGFFERHSGNTLQGVLRGAFKVWGKFGEKTVYRVEVTEGETQIADGEMMGPGAIVGIDETGYTKVLGELESGTGVFIRYEGKSGEGQKDAHVFTVAKAAD